MLHEVLKSKLYNAVDTDSIVDSGGSIGIPRDLVEAAGLWEGEKVLIASFDKGHPAWKARGWQNRLEAGGSR